MKSRVPLRLSKTVKLTAVRLARRVPAVAVWLVVPALALSVSAGAATIITFDASAAGTAAGQGTFPTGINQAGVIVGSYLDTNNVFHGLLRARDGTLTTIDVPAAGTGAFQGTFLIGINMAGASVGDYVDSGDVEHGILRAPSGTITTFNVPAAGTGAFQGTHALNINPGGEISGRYIDSSGVSHGFLRARDGTITTFDVAGAGTAPGQGVFLTSIDGLNPAGATIGAYLDSSNVLHTFVRAADGTITVFDVPGAGTGALQGPFPTGISPQGVIEGTNTDGNNVTHGFLRALDGTVTAFNVPGAGTGAGVPCSLIFVPTCQGTIPENISPGGAITGAYVNTSGILRGFLRSQTGAFTTFAAPGAGTAQGQGTIPIANNSALAITGNYIDANNVNHGFVRIP
jgi:predicted membrane protein